MRPIWEIAKEIKKEWPKMYFGAVPYWEAMLTMDKASDPFYCDSGESIILYFLANANMWRGDAARRIKAELKAMVK